MRRPKRSSRAYAAAATGFTSKCSSARSAGNKRTTAATADTTHRNRKRMPKHTNMSLSTADASDIEAEAVVEGLAYEPNFPVYGESYEMTYLDELAEFDIDLMSKTTEALCRAAQLEIEKVCKLSTQS